MLGRFIRRQLFRSFSSSWKSFIACNSCGVTLQNDDQNKEGYYLQPKLPQKNKLQTLEDVKYMLFSQDIQKAKEIAPAGSLKDTKKSGIQPLICKRCNDAINRNEYNLNEFRRFSYDEVCKHVPTGGNVIHLLPLPEFPFHFSKALLEDNKFTVTMLLTKGDRLVGNKTALQKKVHIFFKDFLDYQLGISTNNIVATSAIKRWNIRSAYSAFKDSNYLLGSANAGKSTLINAMMKEYMGYKIKRSSMGDIIVPQLSDIDLSNTRQFLKTQSAGVSHIPNMTRKMQAYKIGDKVVHDLPGFTTNIDEVQCDNIIKRDWLERIRKTELSKARQLKKKTYFSISGSENGACYTLGGIIFIKPPPETINQIVKYIPGEEYEFKSIEKGLDVFRLSNMSAENGKEHPLRKYCGVREEYCHPDRYARHIIPPFQGSIEIVIKDIGYILLKTTGRYKLTALHEIWLPLGMEVCVREPLQMLIEKSFERGAESKGRSIASPRKRPVVSSTYVMDPNESDTLRKMQQMYLDRTKSDLSSRRFAHEDPLQVIGKLNDEPPNLYWYYQWQ